MGLQGIHRSPAVQRWKGPCTRASWKNKTMTYDEDVANAFARLLIGRSFRDMLVRDTPAASFTRARFYYSIFSAKGSLGILLTVSSVFSLGVFTGWFTDPRWYIGRTNQLGDAYKRCTNTRLTLRIRLEMIKGIYGVRVSVTRESRVRWEISAVVRILSNFICSLSSMNKTPGKFPFNEVRVIL